MQREFDGISGGRQWTRISANYSDKLAAIRVIRGLFSFCRTHVNAGWKLFCGLLKQDIEDGGLAKKVDRKPETGCWGPEGEPAWRRSEKLVFGWAFYVFVLLRVWNEGKAIYEADSVRDDCFDFLYRPVRAIANIIHWNPLPKVLLRWTVFICFQRCS
jgi:hypothetical protein